MTRPDSPSDGAQLSVGDPELRKTRLLSRQCDTCIFRPGNPMLLEPGRLRELVHHALAAERYVICHETLPGMDADARPAICRGFHDRYATTSLRAIALRWGFVEVDPPVR